MQGGSPMRPHAGQRPHATPRRAAAHAAQCDLMQGNNPMQTHATPCHATPYLVSVEWGAKASGIVHARHSRCNAALSCQAGVHKTHWARGKLWVVEFASLPKGTPPLQSGSNVHHCCSHADKNREQEVPHLLSSRYKGTHNMFHD